uniref:Uncharacterized protein n=1 Tax=viral metagenome TaxID=1070528 RepID=A0A6C0LMK1_9ZZZZ
MTDSQSNVVMKRCPNGAGHMKPENDFIGAKRQIVKYCRDTNRKVAQKIKSHQME